MARNKYETLESIDKKMAELENQKRELEKAKIDLAEKDNSRLGKLVRGIFRKDMPLQKSEQTLFFKAVADTYKAAVANGTAVDWKVNSGSKSDTKSDMNGNVKSDIIVDSGEESVAENIDNIEVDVVSE